MVDEVCKEMKPMLFPEQIQISVGANKSKEEEDQFLKPFIIIEHDHDPLGSSSGQ